MDAFWRSGSERHEHASALPAAVIAAVGLDWEVISELVRGHFARSAVAAGWRRALVDAAPEVESVPPAELPGGLPLMNGEKELEDRSRRDTGVDDRPVHGGEKRWVVEDRGSRE